MAATLGGYLKTWLEGLSVAGLAVYRDFAPKDDYPHIIIHEGITTTPDLDGGYDQGMIHTVREQVQGSLWQRLKQPGDRSAKGGVESYAIDQTLQRASRPMVFSPSLRSYGTPPLHVFGGTLLNRRRIVERENGLVQIAYTWVIAHEV